MLPAKKKAKPLRLGDMIRIAWKVPGKTKAGCRGCAWSSTEGIGYPNATREARRHSRESGHVTRVASLEVVEYRP